MGEIMIAIALLCFNPEWPSSMTVCQKRLAACVLEKKNGAMGLGQCVAEAKK